jgi:protein-S-isoprenylcysteine O-methyltransferase Ste14
VGIAGGLLALVGVALATRCALLLAGRGRPRRGPQPAFVVAGPYVRVRNPLLGGLLLALAGAAIWARSPLLAVAAGIGALAAHVFVVRVEEPRLRGRFGAAYAEYLRRVPRWLPSVRRAESAAAE